METLHWEINHNETKLFITDPQANFGRGFEIKMLDDHEMVLKEILDYSRNTKIPTYHILYLKR